MAFENEHADQIHDVRLVEHHMRRQLLTRAEHTKYLENLEDVSAHGTETDTRFASLWDFDHADD